MKTLKFKRNELGELTLNGYTITKKESNDGFGQWRVFTTDANGRDQWCEDYFTQREAKAAILSWIADASQEQPQEQPEQENPVAELDHHELIVTLNKADCIYVNHSGGKDSQAMFLKLIELGYRDQLHIIHADLGDMEWEPMEAWIKQNAQGVPVTVVKSEMNFFELSDWQNRIPGS